MARVSHREKVQLGYSPKSSLHRPISLPKISSRNSDTDFSDVFGGPPRRSSMHENSLNSYKSNDDNEQELWSDFDENPVFGDEIGGRRRYKSGDFFDDIFGGDQSVSSSPRMAGRNPFASNPGSRVLSPARTLPPRAEPLGSTAQYSLPARLANVDSLVPTAVKRRPYGNNNGAVRIAYSSGANMSRFSCQTNPNHDASLVDSCSSIHQSSLSHELSTSSGKETKNMSFDGAEARPSYDAYSKGGEISKDGRQFHFSIYKWARKGVPLRMSPRRNALKSIENGKICRSLNLNGNADSDTLATEIHMADMPDKDTVPFNMIDMASTSGMNYSDEDECLADYSKPQEIVDTSQYFDAAIRSLSKSKSHDSIENKNKQDPIDIKLHHEEETISFLLKTVLFDKADKKIPNIAMDTEKSSLLEQTKGNMEAEKENMAKPKGHLMDDVISSHKEVRKDRLHGSFRDAKRSTGKKGVEGNTGKVKEFVKIFNQESPLKPQIRFSGQSRSCRWRDSNSFNVEIEAKSTSMKMHDESQAPDMNPGKTSSKASVKGSNAHGNSIPSRNRKSGLDSRHNMFETDSTWKENLAKCSGSEPEILTAPIPSITVTSQDDILIREFLEGLEKPSKDFEREEEIKESEIKILQWSKGKEGNIRALLSTLQCVLWANSGWKPVALVDIIEANSVKRAYQKALLCLHPDKLQQKGAASQQKFIAEKVFDILQAAWDHFNSLGGL